jgi:lipid II:glycine glycyltransferase (peptidoglycan interpeptide bridge formation enzyme)
MEHMKELGCHWYDLCGASPSLPSDYISYGVNIFKTGFTKHFMKYTPDFTKCYRPSLDRVLRLRNAMSLARASWLSRLTISLAKPTGSP